MDQNTKVQEIKKKYYPSDTIVKHKALYRKLRNHETKQRILENWWKSLYIIYGWDIVYISN